MIGSQLKTVSSRSGPVWRSPDAPEASRTLNGSLLPGSNEAALKIARRRGLTLMELLIVIAILVALAGIVAPLISEDPDETKATVTRASLVSLRDVILGSYRQDMEHRLPRPGAWGVGKGRADKPQLRYLFINPGTTAAPGTAENIAPSFDPVARRGWRGPYLMPSAATYQVDVARGFTSDYGEADTAKGAPDPAVLDGWRNPIVILESPGHAELRSAGADGVLGNADDVILALY